MRRIAIRPAYAARLVALVFLSLAACARAPAASSSPPPPTTLLDLFPPRIVSAFFGLDHGIPPEAASLCLHAPGKDSMPVTFSRRVMPDPDPESFIVRLRSGANVNPDCATLKPANAPAKSHTVLLIGELGHAATDPPLSVTVSGHLPLAGGRDGKGLSELVVPLADGPTLVLALSAVPGTIASDCPRYTSQIVVVIWAGGVKPASGADQSAHLAGYRVFTGAGVVKPFALGDLDDGDNYVHLCLGTPAPATRVDFPGGILVDPNGDPNPATTVAVSARE
jgi:hypothetical protein